jgi:predicted secreted protein
MTTGAIKTNGTLLQVGDGGTPTEVFTTVAEVRTISGPSLSVDVDDVTSHDSPDGWEEAIATILRSGEVTFDVNFVPTDDTHDGTATDGLLTRLQAREWSNCKLVFPDAALVVDRTTWTFVGAVAKFQPIADPKSALRASVSFKISGKPTLE